MGIGEGKLYQWISKLGSYNKENYVLNGDTLEASDQINGMITAVL